MDERRIPFTQEDEERIASAGVWGIIVAVTSIASTVLGAIISFTVSGAVGLVSETIAVTINVILAIWLYQASSAFRKVALTDEADEHYLLLGFSKLRSYFMMTGILIIVLVSLAVLIVLAMITCGAMFMRLR